MTVYYTFYDNSLLLLIDFMKRDYIITLITLVI